MNEHLVFTTDQAPGAWPNGTRVRKSVEEPGDAHEVGALATVLGSIGPAPEEAEPAWVRGLYGYFVEWDDTPGVPVLVTSNRIERAP
jgi:hypothetical protein